MKQLFILYQIQSISKQHVGGPDSALVNIWRRVREVASSSPEGGHAL